MQPRELPAKWRERSKALEWATKREDLEGNGLNALAYDTEARVLAEIADALEAALAEQGGGWMPIETAPKDGSAFLVTMAAGEVDICVWAKDDGRFLDYFFKQTIAQEWPFMVAWKPLPKPAVVGNSQAESRYRNGFSPCA